MKLLLKIVAGCLFLGQVVLATVPTCTQVKTMQQAIVGAMQTYRPLMPLFVRLGKFNLFKNRKTNRISGNQWLLKPHPTNQCMCVRCH